MSLREIDRDGFHKPRPLSSAAVLAVVVLGVAPALYCLLALYWLVKH